MLLQILSLSLDTLFYGNTLESYLFYGTTVLAFILGGRVLQYALDTYARRLAGKTKAEWDDVLLDILSTPARFLLTAAGLLISAEVFLTFPSPEAQSFYYNVIGLILLGIFTWSLIKLVDVFAEKILQRWAAKTKSNLDDQLIPLFKRASKYIIILLALLIALSNFGYDVTALLAGLGIGGLAVAFAAQETIKDVFGGIVIFSNKTFFVGDRLTVGNFTGTVEQINMRTTRLRNWEGRLVTFPNSMIASSVVENWSKAEARRVFTTLQLTYDTPSKKLEKAKEILKKIANETEGVVKDTPEKESTLAWFANFSSSSLDINFIYFVQDQDRFLQIVDEINMKIKVEFEKAKLDFAYPTQTVYVKKAR